MKINVSYAINSLGGKNFPSAISLCLLYVFASVQRLETYVPEKSLLINFLFSGKFVLFIKHEIYAN